MSEPAKPGATARRERGGIAYGRTATARTVLEEELRGLAEAGSIRFCDVGGGANPLVGRSDIDQHGLDYLVVDASQAELDKAPPGYRQCLLDIADPAAISRLVGERGRFDVVVSKWTAEHIPDGRVFHRHVFSMLRPGGVAVHLFPTLYSPVFVLNRLLPADPSGLLLRRAARGREAEGTHAKFRAYYSWCRGPSRRQVRRLQGVGFRVERYVGFFGHSYYARVKPVHRAHEAFADLLTRHPVPALTSFALVVLRRPR